MKQAIIENNKLQVDDQRSEQQTQLKYRLTGAAVWLLLLVIIVPSWYANPVEFDPDGIQYQDDQGEIVTKAYKVSGVKNLVFSKEGSETSHTLTPKSLTNHKTSKSAINSPSWLVKIAAYKNKQKADEINDRLRYSYKSYIKFFPKSNYYSLRVGPYEDKEEALKVQQELNKLLHIKTNLVKM